MAKAPLPTPISTPTERVSDEDWEAGIWPVERLIEDTNLVEQDHLAGSDVSEDLRPLTDQHAFYRDFFFRELLEWMTKTMMGKMVELNVRKKWLAKNGKESKTTQPTTPTTKKETKGQTLVASAVPIKFEYDPKSDRKTNIHALSMALKTEEFRYIMRRIAEHKESVYITDSKTHHEVDSLREQKKALEAKKKSFKSEREYWQHMLQLEKKLHALMQDDLAEQFDIEAHRLALYRRCMWRAQGRIDESNRLQKTAMSKEAEQEVVAKAMEEEEELAERRKCQCLYVCQCDNEWMDSSYDAQSIGSALSGKTTQKTEDMEVDIDVD